MSARGPALLASLQGRTFRRFWVGVSLSMVADQAFLVALTWLVLNVSGSGASLGVILAVASVPGIVLTPLGGVLCDRFSPPFTMSLTSFARAGLMGTLALLVLTGEVRMWHVYLLAGGLSGLDALYYPASMSAVPRLVGRDLLKSANALTQGVEQISSIAGPALAGLLLASYGAGTSLGANAVLFILSATIFVTVARPSPSVTSVAGNEVTEGHHEDSGTPASLVRGIRYAWGDPVIRTIMLVLVGINLAMAGPIYVGGSVLAESRLGGAGAFGVLIAAGGAGALVGAVVAGSLGKVRRRGLVELSLTAMMGLGVGALAFVSSLVVAVVLATLIGAAASLLAVVNISWLQERSGPGLVGRVMSLAMFSTIALDPVSYLLAGALVEVSLTAVFLAAGGLLVITALLGATSRTMRLAD